MWNAIQKEYDSHLLSHRDPNLKNCCSSKLTLFTFGLRCTPVRNPLYIYSLVVFILSAIDAAVSYSNINYCYRDVLLLWKTRIFTPNLRDIIPFDNSVPELILKFKMVLKCCLKPTNINIILKKRCWNYWLIINVSCFSNFSSFPFIPLLFCLFILFVCVVIFPVWKPLLPTIKK